AAGPATVAGSAGAAGPATTAIDLGAGTGKLTLALAARGLNVAAVDPSAAMLEVIESATAPVPGTAPAPGATSAPTTDPAPAPIGRGHRPAFGRGGHRHCRPGLALVRPRARHSRSSPAAAARRGPGPAVEHPGRPDPLGAPLRADHARRRCPAR